METIKEFNNWSTEKSFAVFVYIGTTRYDVTELVQGGYSWGGANNESRWFEATLVDDRCGLQGRIPIKTAEDLLGCMVVFRYDNDNTERFRGYIFEADNGKNELHFKAYDSLIYTTLNNDDGVFKKKTASEIATKKLKDIGLPIGKIADTKYKIPYKLFEGDTIYDMIMTGLKITYSYTGKKFRMYSEKGKIYISEQKDNLTRWLISDVRNMTDYKYSVSIMDTKTKVKLVHTDTDSKKTIKAVYVDDKSKKKYGTLQYYENVSDISKQANLNKRAKKVLAEKSKPKVNLDLGDVLGIADVISGTVVYVYIKDIGIARAYNVVGDTHTFDASGTHKMKLTLSKNYELPDVNVGSDKEE